MKLTNTVREKVNDNLAHLSIDLSKSPNTVYCWARKRQYMFLNKVYLEILKKYAETDNLDDIFEFESDEERELLLKKYKVL